jgi:hypothetical protein
VPDVASPGSGILSRRRVILGLMAGDIGFGGGIDAPPICLRGHLRFAAIGE